MHVVTKTLSVVSHADFLPIVSTAVFKLFPADICELFNIAELMIMYYGTFVNKKIIPAEFYWETINGSLSANR